MKPDPAIFERNLAALVGRAYEPVRPHPAFRRELHRRLLEQVGARTGTASRPTRVGAWAGRLAAAAVLLVGLTVLVRWMTDSSPRGMADILRDGAVAHRSGPEAAWRALTPRASRVTARAEQAGGDWRVPAAVSLELDLPPGVLAAQGPAALSARRPAGTPDGLQAQLEHGTLHVRHERGSEPWVIDTVDGRVFVDGGEVVITASAGGRLPAGGRVRLDVRAGRVWLVDPDGQLVTPAGAAWTPNSRPVAEAGAPQPLDLGPDPLAEPETGPAPWLFGQVTDARAGTPVTAYQLFLVPRLPPPNVEDTIVVPVADAPNGLFVVTGDVIGRTGTYTVFVHAPGYAPARADTQLGPGTPVELDLALETGAVVRGRVRDEAGEPVADAWVISQTDAPFNLLPVVFVPGEDVLPPGAARTGVDGAYQLRGLAAGRQTLRASRPGSAPVWAELPALAAGEQRDDVDLVLARGGRVHGTVRTPAGTPRAGVPVVATLFANNFLTGLQTYGRALTDASGRYAIDDLPPGTYVVVVVDQGAGAPAHTEDLPEDGALPLQQSWRAEGFAFVALAPGGEALADLPPFESPGTRLHGRVTDANGHPVTDRTLQLSRIGTRPDQQHLVPLAPDGSYRVEGLEPGRWLVFQGKGAGAQSILVDELDIPGPGDLEHDLVLSSLAVDVTVVDAAEGRPAPFAVLLLVRQLEAGEILAGKLFTDGQGQARLEDLPPATYRVLAYPQHGRWAPSETTLVLEPEAAPQPVELVTPLGGRLVVRVVDPGGAPLPGIRVRLLDIDLRELELPDTHRTDETGRFAVRAVAPGRWHAVAEGRDGTTARGQAEVVPDGDHEVVLVLPSPGR